MFISMNKSLNPVENMLILKYLRKEFPRTYYYDLFFNYSFFGNKFISIFLANAFQLNNQFAISSIIIYYKEV